MKQLSREALWESVCSTTNTLEQLLSEGLIRFLPLSAYVSATTVSSILVSAETGTKSLVILLVCHSLPCILIPFTCNNLFVKTRLQCNIVSIESLSTCAKSFRILAERYEAADFYMDILNESLDITHRMMLDARPGKERWPHDTRVGTLANTDLKAKDVEVPLPQADIYSYVIRFQEISFATGSVAKAKC